jgi:hypothetical protein
LEITEKSEQVIHLAMAVVVAVLPNSSVTPGAINPSVTQSNIQQTICKSGYTATIRPPASYTTKLKATQLATTYKSFTDKALASYEEDHLISLEIGGNPTDPKNLWPEPYASIGARIKDQIENKLNTMVCTNKMTLATAQHLIATDWYSAYKMYVVKK